MLKDKGVMGDGGHAVRLKKEYILTCETTTM
jgi:hypothetical protein